MSTLKIAEEMARRIHAGQTDKQNKPYIEHLEFVANEVATSELKIIAYLHDAIEDHPGLCDYKKLREEGFSKEIIAAIESITRRSDKDSRENYWDYIRRVADNDLAIDVKLADLKHNSMHTRISNPTEKDEARWKRYGKAKKYLNDVKTFKAEGLSVDIKKPPYCYVLHRWLYGTLQDDYTKMCDAIKQILENASKSVCASAVVQGRIKNLDSFTEKCARKASKYGQQHFKMMTDLCGTRVILQTTAQVADYCELVKQYFEIDWANSEDTGTRLGKAEFGYISQHYVVSFNKDVTNILGVEINPLDFKGMKAEIQVRTFAQHISADTLHDRIYKSLVTPLKEHIRESARIDSMLENIDAILARFVDKFDRFSLNQTSYLTVSKIEEEISILEAMNYGEEHAFTRFRNALKMAEYRRSLGHYKEMQILLEPFIKEVENGKQILDETNKARLWFEYGISLLADQKIDADEWIENALNQFKHFEKDRSDKWLESRRFYVFMLLTAGTIAEDINWLERALRVDYANPYACAKLLHYNTLESGLLQAAVAIAEEHLRAGINEPEIYFVLGRLHIALREEATAFLYYADGLLFYGAKAKLENAQREGSMNDNIRLRMILERELPYLKNCNTKLAIIIASAIKELFTRVYDYVYTDSKPSEENIIWVNAPNKTLEDSASGYTIRQFKNQDLVEQIREMAQSHGYLFMQDDNVPLVKAALILGLRVISVNREMNIRLVEDEKIRITKKFYTLPCEKESLTALFVSRNAGFSVDLIEKAAKNGHERYVAERIEEMRKAGKSSPDFGERTAHWEVLNPTFKRANINRSAYIPVMLASLGFTLNDNPDGAIGWDDIEEKELLARAEHGRWNAERVEEGWCYYPVRDNGKMLQPYLVAFDELSDEIKKYDYISMEAEIDNFARAGLFLHR